MAARIVDKVIEGSIFFSFTNIGSAVRRRMFDWEPLPDAAGKVVLVTGATSGLGRSMAETLAQQGAAVRMLARNEDKARRARDEIRRATGNDDVGYGLADLASHDAVRSFAEQFLAENDRLDAVIHNAGALLADRVETADGLEFTYQTQITSPVLLTTLLLPLLATTEHSRVITVASGGMYSEKLDGDSMQMSASNYDGVKAYAKAKRVQVSALLPIWAEMLRPLDVSAHAMHPGWADTPGVEEALPTFGKVVGPLLRDPDDGAETAIWLALRDDDGQSSGGFWHDRRVRSTHKVPWTRRDDEQAEAARIWTQVTADAGVDPQATIAALVNGTA